MTKNSFQDSPNLLGYQSLAKAPLFPITGKEASGVILLSVLEMHSNSHKPETLDMASHIAFE
jgi:hypothetical protein